MGTIGIMRLSHNYNPVPSLEWLDMSLHLTWISCVRLNVHATELSNLGFCFYRKNVGIRLTEWCDEEQRKTYTLANTQPVSTFCF